MKKRNRPRFSTIDMLTVALIGMALAGSAVAEETLSASRPTLSTEPGTPPSASSPEELSKLLPLLLTSTERRQFAAELMTSIQHGDLKTAESRLNTAIELGSLAILLVDRIQDPDLLPSFQALGIRESDKPSQLPSPAANGASSAVCGPAVIASAANPAELQEALDREHAQNSAAVQQLAALTQDYRSLTARQESDAASAAARISDLQTALRQEQEQRTTALRQLASLQEEYRTLQDLQARNADQAKSTVSTAGRTSSGGKDADMQRLFEEFLQWRERRGRQ